MTLPVVIALVGIVVTAIIAMREHRSALAARRTLLDRCVPLLTGAEITLGSDGFPRLEGRHRGRFVRVELVPDSMTVRRLPQLWLKVTRLEARPRQPEFSILSRPTGAEFYSLTSAHRLILKPPTGLGMAVMAKGSSSASQQVLDASARALESIFRDPRMKEAAVTARGLRLVWQAAEGGRGEHLLRQCRFERAGVDADALAGLLTHLDTLSASLDQIEEAEAA